MKKLSIGTSISEDIYNEFRIEDYLLHLKIQGLAYASLQYYIGYIKVFIEYSNFNNIEDFNNIVKLRFAYYKLTDKPITKNTIGKYYKCIRKYYYFLKEIEVSDKILIDELPNVKTTRALPKSLSEEDVYIIREALKKKYDKSYDIRDYLIFETFINTGVRRAELARLKVSDISKNHIRINSGKGNKDRLIYISNGYSKMILDYIDMLGSNITDNTSLFNLSLEGVGLAIRRISRISNIHFYPHLLRHTYASLCVKKGVNLYTLQQQMGHSDLKTTSIYLYLNSRENWEEIQKLQF